MPKPPPITPPLAPAGLLAQINDALAAGKTVVVANTIRVTPFAPAIVAKLRAVGIEPFRLDRHGEVEYYQRWSPKHARAIFVPLTFNRGYLHARVTIGDAP